MRPRGGRARPYLELVRPPALFTAAADSVTGWAWVRSFFGGQSSLGVETEVLIIALLSLISASVYAAGMCSNDIFDRAEDLRDRPQRPLPSGRVPLRRAWLLVISLQLIAITSSVALSWALNGSLYREVTWAVIATICATYLYNRVFKQSGVAPLVMGLCRFGNFWIGGSLYWLINIPISPTNISLNEVLAGGLYLSLGTLVYVTALTALSRFEISGGSRARLASLALCLAALHPVLSLSEGVLQWGALGALLVSAWLASRMWRLVTGAETSAAQAQRGVGAGIKGVALTNLVICAGLEAWWAVALLSLMVIGATRMGRWFYAT